MTRAKRVIRTLAATSAGLALSGAWAVTEDAKPDLVLANGRISKTG